MVQGLKKFQVEQIQKAHIEAHQHQTLKFKNQNLTLKE